MFPPQWKGCAGTTAAALLIALSLPSPAPAQLSPPSGKSIGSTANNPPVIVSLQATQVPGRKFQIYGRVADETPASCGVVISGAASGVLLCDAGGNFSGVFDVPTLGQITAVAGDGQLSSRPAVLNLTNAAPTISNFTAVGGPNNTWTFSGTVGDEAPGGLTVTLSGPTGVQGATATVANDGSWSVTLTLPAGTSGNVTATVTDWYGDTASAYTSF
jgi:hypothetical protein